MILPAVFKKWKRPRLAEVVDGQTRDLSILSIRLSALERTKQVQAHQHWAKNRD
jgi:hypothetical protein